jgi:hypothetical protein
MRTSYYLIGSVNKDGRLWTQRPEGNTDKEKEEGSADAPVREIS